jgi:hypothetical protein
MYKKYGGNNHDGKDNNVYGNKIINNNNRN